MNVLQTSLGWMLLHSLWQAALLFLLGKSLAFLLKKWGANTLYNVWALLLLVLCFGNVSSFTYYYLQEKATPIQTLALKPQTIENQNLISQEQAKAPLEKPSFWQEIHYRIPFYLPYFIRLWFLGIVLLAIRFAFSFYQLKRLQANFCTLENSIWQQKIADWQENLGISRQVKLLLTEKISAPFTTGFWKPVIICPVALLSQLPPEQLESLFLHELAHIRRHDYLVHLLQNVIEIFLFFNPFVWLISQHIREQREFCCDDFVLGKNIPLLDYLKALAAIQAYNLDYQTLALPANYSHYQLLNRMKRMKNVSNSLDQYQAKFRTAMLALALILGVAYAAKDTKVPTISHKNELTGDSLYVDCDARKFYLLKEKKVIAQRNMGETGELWKVESKNSYVSKHEDLQALTLCARPVGLNSDENKHLSTMFFEKENIEFTITNVVFGDSLIESVHTGRVAVFKQGKLVRAWNREVEHLFSEIKGNSYFIDNQGKLTLKERDFAISSKIQPKEKPEDLAISFDIKGKKYEMNDEFNINDWAEEKGEICLTGAESGKRYFVDKITISAQPVHFSTPRKIGSVDCSIATNKQKGSMFEFTNRAFSPKGTRYEKLYIDLEGIYLLNEAGEKVYSPETAPISYMQITLLGDKTNPNEVLQVDSVVISSESQIAYKDGYMVAENDNPDAKLNVISKYGFVMKDKKGNASSILSPNKPTISLYLGESKLGAETFIKEEDWDKGFSLRLDNVQEVAKYYYTSIEIFRQKGNDIPQKIGGADGSKKVANDIWNLPIKKTMLEGADKLYIEIKGLSYENDKGNRVEIENSSTYFTLVVK